jgi:hypothetical protein
MTTKSLPPLSYTAIHRTTVERVKINKSRLIIHTPYTVYPGALVYTVYGTLCTYDYIAVVSLVYNIS